MIGMTYKCNGPHKKDADGAVVVDENGIAARMGCGASLTELILAVPQDGKDYEVVCPQCGNVSSVMHTAPD